MAIDAPAYPADRQADVVLRDGSTATIRPVRPDDQASLLRFFESLSPESRYLRFFSGAVNLEQVAAAAARVDYHDRYASVECAPGRAG